MKNKSNEKENSKKFDKKIIWKPNQHSLEFSKNTHQC